MQKASLIFNPVSGQGQPEQDLEQLRTHLNPYFDLEILTTTPNTDADVLTEIALERRAEVVIVAGGDGTVSKAAAVLNQTGIPLGIIPRGTANGLANALGLPTNFKQACDVIGKGHVRPVDLAECRLTTATGEQRTVLMVLLAGIGFEATVVENADRAAKDRWGILAYIWSGFQQLRQLDLFTATLELDSRRITTPATALTIANAAPPTSILAQGPAGVVYDDGLLDVTIVASETRLSAIAASYTLLRSALLGEAADQPGIGYVRTPEVTVQTDPPQGVVIDGEIVGYTPLTCTCIPQGLQIFCPTSPLSTLKENLVGLSEATIEPRTDA